MKWWEKWIIMHMLCQNGCLTGTQTSMLSGRPLNNNATTIGPLRPMTYLLILSLVLQAVNLNTNFCKMSCIDEWWETRGIKMSKLPWFSLAMDKSLTWFLSSPQRTRWCVSSHVPAVSPPCDASHIKSVRPLSAEIPWDAEKITKKKDISDILV